MSFVKDFKNINLEGHGVRLPEFEVNDAYKASFGFGKGDNEAFLTHLVEDGFKRLVEGKVNDSEISKYRERVDYELTTVKDLGFVDYFLLVWDVLNYCNDNDIPTGYARGSAASSLVLYLIGVTRIDSLKYNLYFERFISKTRAKKKVVDGITYLDGSLMCDVDIDICYYKRPKVLEYLDKKFAGRTSKILTFNTLSGKSLIKDCGKIVAGKSDVEMTIVSSSIPKVYGKVRDIKLTKEGEKYTNEKDIKENGKWKYRPIEEFATWCENNEKAYEIALKLRGLNKNKGIHPSGVVVSYDKLHKSCPTELSSGKDKKEISSFDMNWVLLSNVKLDILGLRSVSVVKDCLNQIGKGEKDIDLEDPSIYIELQDLKHPHGLFQIEAETNFKVCQKVKPKNLEQLSAVLALGRPGSLAFVDQYAKYSNGEDLDPVDIESDKLKNIIAETGNTILYQETLMRIAHEVFELSLLQAEDIRKATGKKDKEKMEGFRKIVFKKGESLGIPKSAKFYWDVLLASADYSFNKSHSIAYASLSALTVYLKVNHPKEFFLSLLKMARRESDATQIIATVQREMKKAGIKLLPPHIMKSEMDFSIEDEGIRFGLLSIKGISDKSKDSLNAAKTLDGFKHDYTNKFEIFQGAQTSKIVSGVLCALIQAGALDGFKQSRTKVVYEAQVWSILTEKERNYALKLGSLYDYDLVKTIKALTEFEGENGKIVIPCIQTGVRKPRFETIKKRIEEKKYKKIYDQNNKFRDFTNWYYETSLLGYPHTSSLRQVIEKYNPSIKIGNDISDFEEMEEDSTVSFLGRIDEVVTGVSKKKTEYARFIVSDETASVTVMAFHSEKMVKWKGSSPLQNIKKANGDKLPAEGDIVKVSGVKKGDAIFSDRMDGMKLEIYTRLAEFTAVQKSKAKKKEIEKKN